MTYRNHVWFSIGFTTKRKSAQGRVGEQSFSDPLPESPLSSTHIILYNKEKLDKEHTIKTPSAADPKGY